MRFSFSEERTPEILLASNNIADAKHEAEGRAVIDCSTLTLFVEDASGSCEPVAFAPGSVNANDRCAWKDILDAQFTKEA